MAENLDHLLAGHRFLDVAVQRSQSRLLRLVEAAAAHGDGTRREHHQRHRRHRDQGQPHVGVHHQAEGADHVDGAGNDLHHRVVQHLSHRVHVVGEPAHDIAVVVGIVKPHRQLLDPGKQVVSQAENGPLGNADHDPGLKILGGDPHRIDGRHPKERGKQLFRAALRRGQAVNDGAEHIRTCQGGKGGEDNAEKHHRQPQPVLLDIGKKPPHRLRRILRLPAPSPSARAPSSAGPAALGLRLLRGIGIFPDQGFFSFFRHDALTSLSIWES